MTNKEDILIAKKAYDAAILQLTEELRRCGLQGFCLDTGKAVSVWNVCL